MTPNEYFDEIYVLTIPRRSDRYLELKNRLIRENIYVKTFYGCDKLDVENEYNKFLKKHDWEWSIGNYAIMNSYYKLFKHIYYETTYDKILILEDDVLFHKDFASLFSKSIGEIPEKWLLWYLGYVRWDLTKLKNLPDKKTFVYPNNMTGNFAISFKRDSILMILESLELGRKEGKLTTDQIIKRRFHKKLNTTIVSNPMLVGHNYGWSDTAEREYSENDWGRHQEGVGRWINKDLYH